MGETVRLARAAPAARSMPRYALVICTVPFRASNICANSVGELAKLVVPSERVPEASAALLLALC